MTLLTPMLLAVLLIPFQQTATATVGDAPRASIGQLTWLAGSWSGTSGTSTIEEHWTAPAGGAMLAVARTIRGERMRAFEFLRIEEREGSLSYLAMPNGRSPATEFRLALIGERTATFENPAHDFPQRIRYTLTADGALEATISAMSGDKAQTFRFRRQP